MERLTCEFGEYQDRSYSTKIKDKEDSCIGKLDFQYKKKDFQNLQVVLTKSMIIFNILQHKSNEIFWLSEGAFDIF